jgi:L-fuconolactonase
MGYQLDPIRKAFGPAELEPELHRASIDRTILVQTVSSVRETGEFLSIAATADFVAGVVGWVDLSDRSAARTIAQLKAGPGGDRLVGIRHQVEDEGDPDWLLQPDVQSGLAAVGEAGLTFDLLVRVRQLPAATEAVRRNPQVQFVLDHCAKPTVGSGPPPRPWVDAVSRLAELPNVACKISGLVTEADWSSWTPEQLAPYIEMVVEWFGRERCMFGSDWPVCLLAASYRQVVEIVQAVTGDDADVFGAVATRVYRL